MFLKLTCSARSLCNACWSLIRLYLGAICVCVCVCVCLCVSVCVSVCVRLCPCLWGLTEIRHGKIRCQTNFSGWFCPDRNNIRRGDKPDAHTLRDIPHTQYTYKTPQRETVQHFLTQMPLKHTQLQTQVSHIFSLVVLVCHLQLHTPTHIFS